MEDSSKDDNMEADVNREESTSRAEKPPSQVGMTSPAVNLGPRQEDMGHSTAQRSNTEQSGPGQGIREEEVDPRLH